MVSLIYSLYYFPHFHKEIPKDIVFIDRVLFTNGGRKYNNKKEGVCDGL